MMIKIAYLGDTFYGFARQPGLRTVEGEILQALTTVGYTGKVYSASRTDKGVSALCNVIKVNMNRKDICRMLTGLLHNIIAYAYTFHDANPRFCTKHYTYFLPGCYPEDELDQCCQLFSGEHDFFAFTKINTKNTMRTISVDYEIKESMVLFHFAGRSFLWEMIRRIMTAIKAYLTQEKPLQNISDMLKRKVDITQKPFPAPAENLLLAHLDYPFSFTLDTFSVNKLYTHIYSQHQFYTMKNTMFTEILHSDPLKKGKKEF